MAERDLPDGRMQKLMGKPWCHWNLPDQPNELDLRKLRDTYLPPEQYRSNDHQSTPIPSQFLALFGTHPDSDFMSITKCPACGWLLKIQHANKHFMRDSRGAIVCKDSELAIYGSKVLGKAAHPCGELRESWSRRITLRLVPPAQPTPSLPLKQYHHHSLRGAPSITDFVSKSRSGSHSTMKTDYSSHSQYRSRSHSQMHIPPAYMPKSRSGSSGSGSHGHLPAHASTSSMIKNKSVKSHSSSSSSWSSSSMRSTSTSTTKVSGSHKTSHGTSGSYTLSIPSEDMGHNESVEDLLISHPQHVYGSSKHVHIIATQNSSKSKVADKDYDHHGKFYSEIPEKRIKLDSHSHHHRSHTDSHDSYKSKQRHSSSSHHNGVGSDSLKKSKSSSSSSSALSHSKSESSTSKHHLRSSAPSTIVTISKPVMSVPSMSQSRSHTSSSHGSSLSSSHHSSDKSRDRDRSGPSKKKKRKRDKDEPRKIIPLKDRDFNPDKHCGVCAAGSHSPCKRSLTCKTHSIALRRAVGGRSKSFDALLAAHKLAKNEEKVPAPKEVVHVEEVSQKPKKKKPSGNSSISTSSPNELGALATVSERTNYVRTRAPDVEVLVVKSKPKPPPQPPMEMVHCFSKKFTNNNCPLVYPYTPETQAKFEAVWFSPGTLDHNTRNEDERKKFVFLLTHYKNPYFVNWDIKPITPISPLSKNPREKRNVVRET